MNLPRALPPGAKTTYSQCSKVPGPYVAMTFDDGPHKTLTPQLLDMLRERNIRATFYVVGSRAKRHPEILRRMIAEGHEIGNHTVTHPTLTRMSDAAVRKELRDAENAIVQATGLKPLTMRPPGGALATRQRKWIQHEFGYPTIMWSVDPQDWRRPGISVVTRRIVDGARNGAIILAHDIHSPTIKAMPGSLDGLLKKGFRFVTVSQLIQMEQQTSFAALTSFGPGSL